MNTFPGGEGPLMDEGPKQEHRQVELYGHVEGLCREEVELLELQEHERTTAQHERLHAIQEELDRIAERLHERAHHLGRPSSGAGGHEA